jgi:ComF family protein
MSTHAAPGLTRRTSGWAVLLIERALSLLYPEVCQLCSEAKATRLEGYVCAGCRAKVRRIEPPFCSRCGRPFEGEITQPFECGNCEGVEYYFSSARAAGIASGVVLEAIHRYKYQRALWIEPFLSELLISQARPALAGQAWDWIVPVPLHATKQREREFNQAVRLGARLSAAVGIPMHKHLLRRVLPTRTQTLLSREERRVNVRGAFALHREACVNGARLVLVDDVLTTGATANACAGALAEAGAAEVCVWTVARGI